MMYFYLYYLLALFICLVKILQDFTNDLWCFKSGDYLPLFLIMFINVFYMHSLFITFYLLLLF